MAAHPQAPPEAQLIARKRKAMTPELSMRQAAQRAGFSAALWAKIEHGYDQVAKDIAVPYRGTDDKVARAARIVGITPAELTEAGRAGAARELAAMPPAPQPGSDREIAELREQHAAMQRELGELRRELRELQQPQQPSGHADDKEPPDVVTV